MKSDCFCSWTRDSDFRQNGSDLLMLKEVKNLKGRSTCSRILIVFPQTSSLRIKKLCFVCFEDNEAVIKMVTEREEYHNETCFQDSQSCA